MKIENLILLGAIGLGAYFLLKSGLFGEGFASGGGGANIPTPPVVSAIVPGAGSGIEYGPSGNVVRHFNAPPATSIPIGLVTNVPGGVVRRVNGSIEGVLIKGKTNALFFNPGAAQVAQFMSNAVAGGKTFPLNNPSNWIQPKKGEKRGGR